MNLAAGKTVLRAECEEKSLSTKGAQDFGTENLTNHESDKLCVGKERFLEGLSGDDARLFTW